MATYREFWNSSGTQPDCHWASRGSESLRNAGLTRELLLRQGVSPLEAGQKGMFAFGLIQVLGTTPVLLLSGLLPETKDQDLPGSGNERIKDPKS